MFGISVLRTETSLPKFRNSPIVVLLVPLNTEMCKQIAAKQTNVI